jgi:hypothetical protein
MEYMYLIKKFLAWDSYCSVRQIICRFRGGRSGVGGCFAFQVCRYNNKKRPVGTSKHALLKSEKLAEYSLMCYGSNPFANEFYAVFCV